MIQYLCLYIPTDEAADPCAELVFYDALRHSTWKERKERATEETIQNNA